ncbi:MAG: START domain-containing protein [Bacteroidota bacterium]
MIIDTFSQPWNFVKEKDGIKIYTRTEANNSLKSFKGEADFHTSMEKVYSMLGNARNDDWWDKNITDIKVLAYEENKFIQYYLIYNMPWPLTNRDLVAETKIEKNPVNGEWTFIAEPLFNIVPEKDNIVRISKYYQKWTVQPKENGNVHVILEGFINPGGNVPAWAYNMIVPETPYKTIRSLRERVLSNKPAKY